MILFKSLQAESEACYNSYDFIVTLQLLKTIAHVNYFISWHFYFYKLNEIHT